MEQKNNVKNLNTFICMTVITIQFINIVLVYKLLQINVKKEFVQIN